MDGSYLVPIAAGVATNLATQIVTAIPGWAVHRLRGSKEGSALLTVVAESVCQAFFDASRDSDVDAQWIRAVVGEWEPAFTPAVSAQLIAVLRGGQDPADFRAATLEALEASGADLTCLDQTIDVPEFLHALPRRLFDGLRTAALAPDSGVRNLVGALLQQDALSMVAGALYEASPREYRADLSDLLRAIEQRAVREDLPRFAPPGSSISTLTAAIRVRRGVRTGDGARDGQPEVYALPSDVTLGRGPVVDWQHVAEREDRVVVLGDPGMGKSWLIRFETARLSRAAWATLESGAPAESIEVPVPIRCDELAASATHDLAESVCAFLSARYAVPQRSRRRLETQVRSGKFIMLLDALDELPDRAARRHLDELIGSWMSGGHARFRLTSRIAGYTGAPGPGAKTPVYEIQPFTESEVTSLINAWGLPPELVARLHEHVSDVTMASLARVPLLTALLCAAASGDEDLPRTTAGIYERMLRRFLAQENRWPQSPEPEATEIDQLVGIIAPLAFHFAVQSEGWTDRMPATQIMAVMRGLGPAYTELGRDAAAVLRDLSVRAGVLVPAASQTAGRNPPYLFLHRTVAEYLVAHHLATLPRAEWLSIVTEHMWFDPYWQPVIGMLGAAFVQQQRTGEAVYLVGYLLGQTADPFHQALLHAARVTAELTDHGILPADVTSRLAAGLAGLIDDHRQWEETGHFLERYLTRLPWNVSRELLKRVETGAKGTRVTTRILAASRDPRVAVRLIGLLDDQSGLADFAFEALGEHDDETYVEEMLQRFEDPNQRYLASVALQGYANSARVLAAMLRYAADPDPAVRCDALHALKNRREDEVVALWRAAVDGQNSSVRYFAVTGLVRSNVPDRIEILTRLIEDPDPVVAIIAADQVMGSELISIEELLKYTRHNSPYVRGCSARALSRHTEVFRATSALIELAADPKSCVRFEAADALANHQSEGATAALIHLLDDDEEIAGKAAESLRAHGRPGVAALVLDWLGRDPESARFARAAASLLGQSDLEARTMLFAALGSTDCLVRRSAALALAGQEDEDVTSALLGRLADPSPAVREAAVTALASVRDPRVLTGVAEALADAAPGVRAAAVTALHLSDQHIDLIARLLPLLADDAQEVRAAVVRKIEKTKSPSILRWICESSTDIGDLLAAAGKAIRELADGGYRALSADDQAKLIRRLSAGYFQVENPAPDLAGSRWSSPAIANPESLDIVDKDMLDAQIVILLQGNNLFGTRVYSYVELPGRALKRLFASMLVGRNFKPSEYGNVLAAGLGEPPPDVREIMHEAFNMIDVPIPPSLVR